MSQGLDRVAARRTHGTVLLMLLLGALLFAAGARAAGAGYWHTSGNRILDSGNQQVRIAAINWYGFETTTFVAHGLWINDYKAILDLIKSSGFNTVRIPYSDQMVSQNPVLGTTNINRNGINTDIAADARALDVLDKIVAYCGTIGLRVILDNHRSNAGNSAQENGLWFTGEFPESTWLANWRASLPATTATPRSSAWICATSRMPAPAGAAILRAAVPPMTGRRPPRVPATRSSRSTRIS